MLAFIIRRVWQMVPTLFGVMLLLFVLFNWVGGDPSYILAGKSLSTETLLSIRRQLGLDLPLWQQFLIFVKQVLTLDFGTSWSTQQPVSAILQSRIGPSLLLTGGMLLVGTVLSVSIAALVAYLRGGLTDRLVTLISTCAMSVSALVYIIAGQYWLAFKWGWFPIMGWSDSLLANVFSYLPLPLLMGVIVGLAPDVRFFRSCFVEEMNHDYVRTARAKGLAEPVIMLKHVLRNAMIPVVTSLMMSLPYLMMGAILLETFFGIPGMGKEVVMAVDRSDFPVIKAITIYIAMATMVFNLLADIVYKLIDPRVHLE
ncbi:ABC transporter permease [Vogesella sp. LIG4]|uniref:ABC transporter permease n=1 Tax=Vogesella sp. LIG4 TaxID=1192162 RepID=UPI00081F9317|nr:ABC transporter permease [Vogesella sp. LIG4]SCK06905.1 peptide/nickel transport system permease protein [Vogesella sp. LIG4]